MTVFPDEHCYLLNDRQFSLALRMRLGLSPFDEVEGFCACGEDLAVAYPDHVMVCKRHKVSERGTYCRHTMLAQSLINISLDAGCTSGREPIYDANLRGDVVIYAGNRIFATDVTVVHTTAPTYIWKYKDPAKLVAYSERVKTKKYSAMAAARGHIFIPFAVDTYGCLGDSASKLLDEISSFAELSGRAKTAAAFKARAIARVMHDLQRANAALMLDASAFIGRAPDGREPRRRR